MMNRPTETCERPICVHTEVTHEYRTNLIFTPVQNPQIIEKCIFLYYFNKYNTLLFLNRFSDSPDGVDVAKEQETMGTKITKKIRSIYVFFNEFRQKNKL